MKNCINDRAHISTLINPYSISIGNAIQFSIENGDKKIIEMIFDSWNDDNDPKKEYTSEIKIDNLKLPLKKGDIIGKLLVKDGTNTIKQVNLISNENIEKENFFKLWFNVIKNIFTGNLIN